MAFSQCWKPICFAFIFALGFFVFSSAPFTYQYEEVVEEQGGETDENHDTNTTRTGNESLSRERRSPEGNSQSEAEKIDQQSDKLNISHFDKDDLELSNEIGPRHRKSLKRKRFYRREHHVHSHKSSKWVKSIPNNYLVGDYKIESLMTRSSKGKSNSSLKYKLKPIKRLKNQGKVSNTMQIQTPADTSLIKSKLIPRPEKKTNDSISVSIRKKPFHFHIPILSENPVELPSFADLLATAMRYKHPLTVDVPTDNKVGAHSPLAKRELESLENIRVERNSPVLDFLDIDQVIMDEIEQRNGNKLQDVNDGIKRSIQRVAPTAENIQQLVGDKDDLQILQKRAKKSKDELALKRSLNRKPRLTRLEIDIENDLRRRKRHQKIIHHHRAKRGLGKWLKGLFHRKTTEMPTPRPSPKKNKQYPTEEVKVIQRKEKNQGRDGGRKQKDGRKMNIRVDDGNPNSDTYIDMLLPKYLRRSSYWERKLNSKDEEIPSSSESSSEEEPTTYFNTPKKPKNEKKKRFRRGIFDELRFLSPMNPNDAGGSSLPHFLQARDTMYPNIFTGSYFSPPIERFDRSVSPPEQVPLTSMSKEEMKIINEIFSNIINEKCYPVNSQVLEVLQYTLSSLIESSQWPEMSVPNNPQVDSFLQKVVNCSSDAVNVMAWKSQRSMQMSFNFEDIEEGSPLLRTKRISDFDIEQEKQKRALQPNYINDGNREPKMTPILQNQLEQLLSLMSNLVTDGCSSIETILMTSALELMRSTVKNTFSNLKVTMDTMTYKEADGLIRSLKKCATFSTKNSNPEPSNQSPLMSEYYNPNNFQRTLQLNNQQNFQPQQNQMNYWDKIPDYSLSPSFPSMPPQPSPVPAPPLLHPQLDTFNIQEQVPQNVPTNYNYNNGYSYNNEPPSQEMIRMAPMPFQYSDTQQQFRPRRNSFARTGSFNFPIVPEDPKQSYYENYRYNFK